MPRPASARRAANLPVTIVVAAPRNGVIGRGGDMPWRMPSSLRQFRALTLGRPMIMGRKTYQAIGRPLDGRDTIVVTRNADFSENGVHVVRDVGAALQCAATLAIARDTDEIIVAGGGEIYAATLGYATCVHLDRIEADLEGDTRFPALEPAVWQEVRREPLPPHPRDEHAATALLFRRIGPARPLPLA